MKKPAVAAGQHPAIAEKPLLTIEKPCRNSGNGF